MSSTPQPLKGYIAMHRIPARGLAAATGCSEGFLSRVLNGERHASMELRSKLAAVIGEPVEALFI